MDIGPTIRKLRQSRRMTQEELAENLGVTVQTVSRWENGVNCPDLSVLPGLCRILGTSADQLLGIGESPKGRKLIRTVEVFELESREEAQKLLEEFRRETFPRLTSARIEDDGGSITLTAEKEFGVELSKLHFEG